MMVMVMVMGPAAQSLAHGRRLVPARLEGRPPAAFMTSLATSSCIRHEDCSDATGRRLRVKVIKVGARRGWKMPQTRRAGMGAVVHTQLLGIGRLADWQCSRKWEA